MASGVNRNILGTESEAESQKSTVPSLPITMTISRDAKIEKDKWWAMPAIKDMFPGCP